MRRLSATYPARTRGLAILSSLAIVCVVAPAALAVSLEEIQEGGGWKMVRLDLDLRLDPRRERLRLDGSMTLELQDSLSHGPTLVLNSRGDVMRATKLRVVTADGREVKDAVVQTQIAHAEEKGLRFQLVRFRSLFARGSRLELEFACEMIAPGRQLFVRKDVAYGSWVEFWYPAPIKVQEGGGLAAGSAARAPGITRLHLPRGWRGLTNGRRLDRAETKNGAVEHWQVETGVARSFVAGPFKHVDEVRSGDLTVAVYLREPKPMGAAEQAHRLAQAIAAMEERFGPYPYATFAIAEVADDDSIHFGAASEQGFIVAKSKWFEAPDGNLALFAHEAAHAWWGNLVSTTGNGSLLCSESLAQFGALLAIEKVEGPVAARDFLHFSRPGYIASQCARGYFAISRSGEDKALSSLESGWRDHTLSDAKGHWIYQMLRDQLGDEGFFATLRAILEDHRERDLSLDTIRRTYIARHPDRGLEQFFSQWLDRPGAPVIDMEWWSLPRKTFVEDRKRDLEAFLVGKERPPFELEVRLEQRQEGPPYHLDLEVEIEAVDGSRTVRTITTGSKSEKFRLEVPTLPRGVRLDPSAKILLWRPAYGPRPSPEVSGG